MPPKTNGKFTVTYPASMSRLRWFNQRIVQPGLSYNFICSLHSMFLFYQEEDKLEEFDEMEHQRQYLPPSPLNEPQDFLDKQKEKEPALTRVTLKDRLQTRIEVEEDATIKANLQWELKVMQLGEQRFPQVEHIYEAYQYTKLPLSMMKIELNKNMTGLMPLCIIENWVGTGPVQKMK